MANLSSLHDLLLAQLEDILDTERRRIDLLSTYTGGKSDENIHPAVRSLINETIHYANRVEEIIVAIDAARNPKPWKPMAGLAGSGPQEYRGGETSHGRNHSMADAAQ